MLKIFTKAATAASAVGAVIPAGSFFTDHAPPLFALSGFLTSGVALLLAVRALARKEHVDTVISAARFWIIVSVITLSAYSLLFSLFTEPTPSAYDLISLVGEFSSSLLGRTGD